MAKKPDKPLAYYLRRNEIFQAVGVIGWWIVFFVALFAFLLNR